MPTIASKPALWLIIASFFALYVFWGGSYIAIIYTIELIPPFVMIPLRFFLAGLILMGIARAGGAPMPTLAQWRASLISGTLLVLTQVAIVWVQDNGAPTGVVAVLIATVPMFLVLFTWLKPGGAFPGVPVLAGLAVGFLGIVLLINPFAGGANIEPLHIVVVLCGAMAWAAGSIYGMGAAQPRSAPMLTGMQLFCGGILPAIIGAFNGDWAAFDPSALTLQAVLAFLFLTVIASVITFSAYVWLLRVVSSARVATYAYVNPVVAVFLGWWLNSEQLAPSTVIAVVVILTGVVLITIYRGQPRVRVVEVAV